MKNLYHILFAAVLFFSSANAFSQDTTSVKSLVQQGIKFHDEGKYAEAIEKYKQALKIDPENFNTNFELGFSYYVSGSTKEAIPILENLLLSKVKEKGGVYDLLGNIYDDDKQPLKAVKFYEEGIKNQPDYQRLYFNLGIAKYRLEKYAEAEQLAIEAIKRISSHASSHKLYADACNAQQKKVAAILGYSSFLLLEPQTARSAAAYKKLEALFGAGATKTGEKSINVNISKNQLDKKDGPSELLLSLTAASTLAKNLPPVEAAEEQLKSVFLITGDQLNTITDNFLRTYYADYFYKLAQSPNMPAFVRYISLSTYGVENKKWFADHDAELKALSKWVDTTPRNF